MWILTLSKFVLIYLKPQMTNFFHGRRDPGLNYFDETDIENQKIYIFK